MPIVLCGCAVPEQFESLPERKLFSNIYYLALVSDTPSLKHKMKVGRGITDDNWIKSSIEFYNWLKNNGENHGITLLDSTKQSLQEGAMLVDEWIKSKL